MLDWNAVDSWSDGIAFSAGESPVAGTQQWRDRAASGSLDT